MQCRQLIAINAAQQMLARVAAQNKSTQSPPQGKDDRTWMSQHQGKQE
jgi:hypothetical protein